MGRESIAAISTPWGEGGIGIVRVSGPEALNVADRVLRLRGGRRLSELPPRTVVHGLAVEADGAALDEVIAFAFRAPRSYTGEDLVEIQGHGSPIVMRLLLQAVLAAGAVLAEPGEFTERAVINGRLNLLQAEAVLDLVRAKTDAAAAAALRRLAGPEGRPLVEAEAETLSLLAEVEAWLDFPEDVPAPAAAAVAERAEGILHKLDGVLAGAKHGRLLAEGAVAVIAGRPNVGKSSLLNALVGEERAIVTSIPGTTRDAIAEEVALGGLPVRLVDTAGLGASTGEFEALGMARSRREIARADLTLLVLDGSEPLTPLDEAAAGEVDPAGPGVVVINKIDCPRRLERVPDRLTAWPAVSVSARTGEGMAQLSAAVVDALGVRPSDGTPALSHLRHIEAAREAREAACAFLTGLTAGLAWDILAEDLRACLAALGRLTGRNAGPELLREIFSRFCVGK